MILLKKIFTATFILVFNYDALQAMKDGAYIIVRKQGIQTGADLLAPIITTISKVIAHNNVMTRIEEVSRERRLVHTDYILCSDLETQEIYTGYTSPSGCQRQYFNQEMAYLRYRQLAKAFNAAADPGIQEDNGLRIGMAKRIDTLRISIK